MWICVTRLGSLVLGAFALLAPARALAATHSPLLPNVQRLRYGVGTVPLCSLSLQQPSTVDPLLRSQLQSLLTHRCPNHTAPAIPLTLLQTSPGGDLPGIDDHASPGSRESYTLTIRKDAVTLRGGGSAGLFYAVQTLTQLVEQDTTLPLVEIEDWPALPYRGFMMDFSHGGIPTVAEVERQLDALASWKANQYFFYVETDLDLTGYPLLHKDANWSPADIRAIVEYARQRHIDVVPCVELYGHLHDLFRLEIYSSMAALPHGGEANPANEAIQKILEDWVRQYAALFPSKWFHLGFDEPFELERAGSAAAGGIPPGTLWLRHLERLAALASSLGKRPLFWADIDEGAYLFNKYPGLAAALPQGAIAAPWFYDARPDYTHLLDLFAANHVPILVTTGISDWDNITPDFDTTFTNINGFLAAGKQAGTLGLLNTEWSDSALALHRQALSALAFGAVAAWQPQPVDRALFFTQYTALRYPPHAAARLASALGSLAQAQTLLRQALGPETSFRMGDDPFEPHTLERVTAQAQALKDSRLAAEAAMQDLTEALPDATSNPDEIECLLLGARMLDYTGMKFLYASEIAANFDALPPHPTPADVSYLLRRETSARNHSRVGDLLDAAGELQSQYRTEWLKQYKPYRLATAEARWSAEQEFWRHFQAAIWTLTRNFKQGDPRPTLADALAVR